MKYFLDAEFHAEGDRIAPISLGIVAEDGRECYVEFPFDWSGASAWLRQNVRPKLTGTPTPSPYWVIREFIGGDMQPEFWAYYGAYDWVVFCQAMGGMLAIPDGWPQWFNELMQFGDRLPDYRDVHHALEDARWAREAYVMAGGR